MDILLRFQEVFNDLISESNKKLAEIASGIGTSPYVILKWKNHTKNLKLGSLVKIADYFNCSLEYLCGKTSVYLNYVPKPCPKFGERVKVILKECNKTSYQLFKNTTIKNSQYHYWTKGNEPLLTSLEIMAKYLGITIDHLVGRDI